MSGPRCLFCRKPYDQPLSFLNLLNPATSSGFCPQCIGKLEPIRPDCACSGCGRDLRHLDAAFVHGDCCSDCARWHRSGRNGPFGVNRSAFTYNDRLKEIVTAFKFRGDAMIAEAFSDALQTVFNRMTGSDLTGFRRRLRARMNPFKVEHFILVPVPLSRERLQERGFNQAVVLASLLGEPMEHALVRVRSEQKQSKKNRRERLLRRDNPFQPEKRMADRIAGRHVVLVDDIYTTGATLRLAANALQALGPATVDSLTLAHG